MKSFTIDTTSSDDERLYIDILGGATVCIIRTDEGIVVDLFSAHVQDDAVMSIWATWAELLEQESDGG